MDNATIQELVVLGKYTFSMHAERERQLDKIFVWELEEALTRCAIIEDYPHDPRGASCLVLGFCEQRPIHAVCAITTSESQELLLVTVYDPSIHSEKWDDNYSKRRR